MFKHLSVFVATAHAGLPLKGVSQAGAEFGENVPGVPETDFTFPNPSSIQQLTSLGFGATRVPFLWERLQPNLQAHFDSAYFANLTATVSTIKAAGGTAILDPHNYARYNGKVIGDGIAVVDFVDFWKRLASHYKDDSSVAFAIMNEPHDINTESWASTAQTTISAIREVGATQLVLVPGNAWTGAHSWFEDWYGTSNADAFAGFSDPGNNFAFELHQYLDSDASGTSANCASATIGSNALAQVTAWLGQNNYKGFLGEFGAGANSGCELAVDAMLSHMDKNSDIWIGWTWWSAGPWWGDYFTSVEPNADGTNKPQLAWLQKYVPVPAPTPAPVPTPSPVPVPSPSDCPGGSYEACAGECPTDDDVVRQACLGSCARRCPDAPTPVPVPTPLPAPSPSDCPGGSYEACAAECPTDDDAVFQACLGSCARRCPDAPTPAPVPTPVPVPAPSPSDCPGGSYAACAGECPTDDDVVYQACLGSCARRCPDAPTPVPIPTPVPAPSPSDCPGGSYAACAGECPTDDDVVYQACLGSCARRCPDAPTPVPSPAPTPVPSPVPSPSDCPGGSLEACIDLCPDDDAAVFHSCVKSCQRRCGDPSPIPVPVPSPVPVPTPLPVPSPLPSGSGKCAWGWPLTCDGALDRHVDAFCDSSKDNCEQNCGGVYCPTMIFV